MSSWSGMLITILQYRYVLKFKVRYFDTQYSILIKSQIIVLKELLCEWRCCLYSAFRNVQHFFLDIYEYSLVPQTLHCTRDTQCPVTCLWPCTTPDKVISLLRRCYIGVM